MPKKAKPALPSWYVSKLKKEAVVKPAARASHKPAPKEKDVNYTIPSLLSLFGIVLVTAIYFAQSSGGTVSTSQANIAGNAYGAAAADSQAPSSCDMQSRCEGTKLVRQNADCSQEIAFCRYGCDLTPSGAQCR